MDIFQNDRVEIFLLSYNRTHYKLNPPLSKTSDLKYSFHMDEIFPLFTFWRTTITPSRSWWDLKCLHWILWYFSKLVVKCKRHTKSKTNSYKKTNLKTQVLSIPQNTKNLIKILYKLYNGQFYILVNMYRLTFRR